MTAGRPGCPRAGGQWAGVSAVRGVSGPGWELAGTFRLVFFQDSVEWAGGVIGLAGVSAGRGVSGPRPEFAKRFGLVFLQDWEKWAGVSAGAGRGVSGPGYTWAGGPLGVIPYMHTCIPTYLPTYMHTYTHTYTHVPLLHLG